MANQTTHLNVSMMNEQDNRSVNGVEREDENLYSFSSDELEELYSSSTSDACGDGCNDIKGEINNVTKKSGLWAFS